MYENMTLMYLSLAYPIHNKIDILGETRWAMGGDYGAYAEGIIGFSKPIINYNKYFEYSYSNGCSWWWWY